ncbi:MAG: NADP-dependent malic enzyme, partial [Muribaculaceae bacterium]|nr:NADP-dependent malic enzyme [Muribaculaceae bacterium]
PMPEAIERMYDRNYFGMMMVDEGLADAVICGTYSNTATPGAIAKEVIGIKPGYGHFATLHIINTKRGVLFLADTMVNQHVDEEALFDICRLTREAVEYFAYDPTMALISFSNFGSSDVPETSKVQKAVERMHNLYPTLAIDGEMQLNYALNPELRDRTFPFSRLKGRQVNTLIFPNLSAATIAYRMLLEMGIGEAVGPIQVGLNKPVHFINVDSPVRDISNLITMAVVDAAVSQKLCEV